MNAAQRARLEAIEAAVDGLRTVAFVAKPVHEMTHSECVQAVYDLCHAHPPGMDLQPSADDAAIVAELRALIREQHR